MYPRPFFRFPRPCLEAPRARAVGISAQSPTNSAARRSPGKPGQVSVFWLFLLVCCVFFGCGPSAGEGEGQQATGGSAAGDGIRIFANGTILTLDQPPTVEALAIEGREILATGLLAELGSRYPSAQRIDLGGRMLLPGFIDSHAHVHELGADRLLADLVGSDSVEAMVERVRTHFPGVVDGEWLVGQGWDEGEWGSRGYPDRAALDQAFPNNPVWLESLHGFAGFANARALELAGIDAETADPEGGTILRRGDGQPTGVLLTLAQSLVESRIPEPDGEQIRRAILEGLELLGAAGVTTVHEAGLGSQVVEAYQALAAESKLPIRVRVLLDGNNDALVDEWISRGPYEDTSGFLSIRGFKVFYDGSLGSRTALLQEPYADRPDSARPTERISPERVRALAEKAVVGGFQMAVHAIGDEGNERVLKIYEDVLGDPVETPEEAGSARGADDPRWRIEHAQVVLPSFYSRAAALGIIASMQPSHAVGDAAWAGDRLGPERLEHAYAWRRMLDAGVPLALNSDLPGEPWEPLETLYFALTRRPLPSAADTEGDAADSIDSSRAGLGLAEALHGMTVVGAWAGFDDQRLGRLLPGYQADLVELDIALDINRESVDPEALPSAEIARVWVAGKPLELR